MSEEIRTTSATGGQKGVKAERHSLLPKAGLDAIARVFAFGAQKYDDNNWRRGYEWDKSVDALLRHVLAFNDGETHDPESGLPHLGHAGFHVLVLLTWLEEQGEGFMNDFDTRWPVAMQRAGVDKLLDAIAAMPPEPKTYGEALDEAIADWRSEVDEGDFDREAYAIQAAAENVRLYGADAEYPCRGLSREEHEAIEAKRAERSRQQNHRMKLALDGLEPEEVRSGWLTRDSVLVEPEPTPSAAPDEEIAAVEGRQEGGVRDAYALPFELPTPFLDAFEPFEFDLPDLKPMQDKLNEDIKRLAALWTGAWPHHYVVEPDGTVTKVDRPWVAPAAFEDPLEVYRGMMQRVIERRD